jgi:hypothetical protein
VVELHPDPVGVVLLMTARSTRLEVTYLTRRYGFHFVALVLMLDNFFFGVISILLDLDMRAKPVWSRRLAEEWRKSYSVRPFSIPPFIVVGARSILSGASCETHQEFSHSHH